MPFGPQPVPAKTPTPQWRIKATSPVKRTAAADNFGALAARLKRLSPDTSAPAHIDVDGGSTSTKGLWTTVGREADVRLASERDPGSTSRIHAMLKPRVTGLEVLDKSANGTLVSGRRISRGVPTIVPFGGTVTFGDNTCELHYKVMRLRDRSASPPVHNVRVSPTKQQQRPPVSDADKGGQRQQADRPRSASAPQAVPPAPAVDAGAVAGKHHSGLPPRAPSSQQDRRSGSNNPDSSPSPASSRASPSVSVAGDGLQCQGREPLARIPQDAEGRPSLSQPHPALSARSSVVTAPAKPSRVTQIDPEVLFAGRDGPRMVGVNEWSAGESFAASLLPDALVTRGGRDGALAARKSAGALGGDHAELARVTISLLLEHFDGTAIRFVHTDESRQHISFALASLLPHVRRLLEAEPPCIVCSGNERSQVFGDLHGSFADLRRVFNFTAGLGDPRYSLGRTVFLGDYVDRGAASVEVVLFLIAWKVLTPDLVVLLRGNHEDGSVNGDLETYGDACLLGACRRLFRDPMRADMTWREINTSFFAVMPIAAVIDGDVLACHGGIPHPDLLSPPNNIAADGTDLLTGLLGVPAVPASHLFANRVNAIMKLGGCDAVRTAMPQPSDPPATAAARSLLRQLMWNDPAPSHVGANGVARPAPNDENDDSVFNPQQRVTPRSSPRSSTASDNNNNNNKGFVPNEARGDSDGAVLEFSSGAVEGFFRTWGFSLLIRAHQHKDRGLQLAHGRRVLTVFTSSNYARNNAAGGVLFRDGVGRLLSWSVDGPQSTLPSALNPAGCFDDGEGPGGSDSLSLGMWDSGRLPAQHRSVPAPADVAALGRLGRAGGSPPLSRCASPDAVSPPGADANRRSVELHLDPMSMVDIIDDDEDDEPAFG